MHRTAAPPVNSIPVGRQQKRKLPSFETNMRQGYLINAITAATLIGVLPAAALAQKPVTVITENGSPSLCKADEFIACVGEVGRYRIEIRWDDFSGNRDIRAFLHSTTPDSAIFKWSSEGALEALVAVNDACALNQRFWVFAASKTTVGFRLSVTDTWSGTKRIYRNEAGNAPIAVTDTSAFPSCFVAPPDLDGDSFPATADRCPEVAGEDSGCPGGDLVGRMEDIRGRASGSVNLFDNDLGIAGEARIYRIGLSFTDLLGACTGPPNPESPGTSCGPDIWLPLDQPRTLEYAGGRVTIEPDGDVSWDLTPNLFPRGVHIQYYFRDARGKESTSAVIISLD